MGFPSFLIGLILLLDFLIKFSLLLIDAVICNYFYFLKRKEIEGKVWGTLLSEVTGFSCLLTDTCQERPVHTLVIWLLKHLPVVRALGLQVFIFWGWLRCLFKSLCHRAATNSFIFIIFLLWMNQQSISSLWVRVNLFTGRYHSALTVIFPRIWEVSYNYHARDMMSGTPVTQWTTFARWHIRLKPHK